MSIKISGIIVPSDLDNAFTAPYIAKGVITPLSRVEAALAEANTDEPLDVDITSQGGSVVAGDQMGNALHDWSVEHSQPVNVTVGSMAASAASTIAAQLGPVKAHNNSRFMFHGASGCAFGGSASHEDVATALAMVNETVTDRLTTRYGLDAEQVAGWFAEGRMGWMNAAEAKEAGLVSEIVDEAAEAIVFDPADIAALAGHGLGIAALLEPTEAPEAFTGLVALAEILQLVADDRDVDAIVAAALAHIRSEKGRLDTSYDAGLAAGKDEGTKAADAGLTLRVEEMSAEVTTLKAGHSAATEAVQSAKVVNESLIARLSALDKGFRPGGGGDSQPTNFFEAVDELMEADGIDKGVAMLQVQRESPALHAQMIAAAKKTHAQE